MRKLGKIGSHTLGALLVMVGPVWATPFTSVVEGHFSSTFQDTNADFIVANLGAFSGYNTTLGEVHCSGVSESQPAAEPSGSCDGVEFVIVPGVNQAQCQLEGSADLLFYDNTEATSCLPFSCFDEGSLLVEGCSGTAFGTAVITGGTDIFEGATGSWTGTQEFTYTYVAEGGFPYAGTTSFEVQGDITLAGGDPPAGAFIDVPAEGSNNSGIGNVSVWSCLGGDLQVEFSDAGGVINTLPMPYGSERLDVEATCGKKNTGGSLPINWTLLGAGAKTIRLIRNGEEVATRTFFVTAFDTEFVSGASGMCTLSDFPAAGQSSTFEWVESQQGLALDSVN